MPKQRLFLIIGVVFAIIAAFATKFYLEQETKRIITEERARMAKQRASEAIVLLAKENIQPGAFLSSNQVTFATVSSKEKNPNAYTGPVEGMLVVSPIAKGEQIVGNKLVPPRQLMGLAENTPVGKRAITIAVDNTASLLGMIKPGDNVDMLFIADVPAEHDPQKSSKKETKVLPLFQNVSVLAVGQEIGSTFYGSQKKEGKDSQLITVALNPNEANMIAFAIEQGKIRLVLRSPKDSQLALTETVNWETLFRYIMPQKFEKAPAAAEPQYPTIDIYRGSRKDKIRLSN